MTIGDLVIVLGIAVIGLVWWVARLLKRPVGDPNTLMRLEPYVTCTCSNNHIWSNPPEATPLCPWCGAPARVWVEKAR